MQTLLDNILPINLVLSTFIFYLVARIYVLPKMNRWAPQTLLTPILLLHAMRHMGLMFLTRGAVYPGMPPQFAYPAAIGDFVTAVLAILALAAVRKNFHTARPLVWTFNIVGSLDLIRAIINANVYQAAPFMGPAYWIPAFWVPALLVTHYLTFVLLTSRSSRDDFQIS